MKKHFLNLQTQINKNPLLKKFGLRLLALIGSGAIILFFLKNSSELDPDSIKYKVQHAKFIYDFYKIIIYCSYYFLSFIGYDAYIYYSETIYKYGVYAIGINGSGSVFMGISCLGISLMGSFVALIVSFPGKVKHKLWYIPLGLLIIQFLNVLRMSTLALLIHYGFKYTFNDYNLMGIIKFNHHDLFSRSLLIQK
ncbi:MAG: exosortase/archaeosortase family protein [Bacteroidetes bacterium]|nr:exosortase/archaeosortase family protein [Bacteroidota bacterium]